MVKTARPLFGTDGVRGRVPYWPLTAGLVAQLGRVVAELAREAGYAPLVVIGRDTRRSGPMLEAALGAGLMEQGFDVASLGIMPTPAVAFLTHHYGAGLGVVISASHNPYPDNGIKFFAGSGFKLPDEMEHEVEQRMQAGGAVRLPDQSASLPIGQPATLPFTPKEAYLEALLARAGQPQLLQGRRLILDCAHGATGQVAPELFRRLGAEVTVLNGDSNGQDINEQCGSEHPERLRETVLRERADAGIAFDGDGDRVLLVDERGALLDGDYLLAILARDMHSRGQLRHETVVGTVMSNLGLERGLESEGVRLERVPVGDRHVARRMREGNFVLGGESSGHIVLFGEGSTTGDGLYTAVKVMEVVVRVHQPLSTLGAQLRKYPQVTINVPVKSTPPLEQLPAVAEATTRVQEVADGRLRILLRYSGTQPLVRVMVEGEDEAQVRWAAELLAEGVRRAIP